MISVLRVAVVAWTFLGIWTFWGLDQNQRLAARHLQPRGFPGSGDNRIGAHRDIPWQETGILRPTLNLPQDEGYDWDRVDLNSPPQPLMNPTWRSSVVITRP